MFKKHARMLTVVFVGIMLTAALSIVSVKASPPITVTISPTSGQVGTTVTVSGINATAGGEVRVYVGIFFFAFFAETTTANSTGGYSVNITVPALPVGTYAISVLDVETGDTNTAWFDIQPTIVLIPEEGSSYDEIAVEGYGFNSGNLITLTFDGNDVTPTPQPETDDFGSFEAKFTVPSAPNGTYTVTAEDEGANSASTDFITIPKITLSTTSGPPASLVYVNGTGFGSSVAYSIEFDAINVTMYGTISTNGDGSFMQIFLVPDVPDGTHTVKATDEDGNSATALFLVPSPTMTLEPSTTFSSSMVTAKGSGFPPNQPVLLYLEGTLVVSITDLMTESQSLFADEYGSYEYSFVVLVAKPGVYTVTAYSVSEDGGLVIGEELASASLTIIENPTITGNLTDINARVVSINGTVATIETDIGTIKADVSDIKAEVVPTGYEISLLAMILALIAAIGAWISVILARKKTSSPAPNPTLETKSTSKKK